ncbi:uncharacterized protein A4U43_C01F14950 [Asparagus officinalis]|uniref:TLDc domain-containing protein n=1 Tax=Asparagus officinalis TaxID=4686 RepID=A0A5P1FPF4_ASPOF|nr:uncharacterized protein LOC109823404 [Asparagus officinalis]ONK80195.1 uncharacterized protein A4U43_C01F14950 [Asparagus officinalis]
MPASSSLNLIFKLYHELCDRAQIPCQLEFDSESDKAGGELRSSDLTALFEICWAMERYWRVGSRSEAAGAVPDFKHLVMSVLVDGGEVEDDERIWGCEVLGMDRSVSAQKVQLWVMSRAPELTGCLSRFVREKVKACAAGSSGDSISSAGDNYSSDVENAFLLTCGQAWAISLTLRNTLREELSGVSFPELVNESLDNILYRSSVHGKGLNRFWSNVEGYHGPVLVLVSASSVDTSQSDSIIKRWVIGVLTGQGFENRETFYGNSGHLYAINPVFRVISPSGKEKNFMYSHLHLSGRVYEPNPKPIGLGFGGTLGSERIFVDEDFAKVTVRHHAVDKTFQNGSLIPNQGFLPVEASVLEVEVWGFGGKAARQQQDSYKKRETLFTEQRRKVDLKTFGNWEDSPEKMMMDMTSDPNRVQREDR